MLIYVYLVIYSFSTIVFEGCSSFLALPCPASVLVLIMCRGQEARCKTPMCAPQVKTAKTCFHAEP